DYTAARTTIDLRGRYLAPGFIDPHIHLESSLLWVTEFARTVVPHGTSVTVSDPHEIANVLGVPGMQALLAAAQGLPLRCYFTMPWCVPASPRESAGATFGPDALAEGLTAPQVLGLSELMAYPDVVAAAPDVLARAVVAARAGQRIDGHAPRLRGRPLQAYI